MSIDISHILVGSTKYLFKYINKGQDRITASIVDSTKKKKKHNENNDHDEIYDIDYRKCLLKYYHFTSNTNVQVVVFNPYQYLTKVVSKPTVTALNFWHGWNVTSKMQMHGSYHMFNS
uniref:Uncharacterized protein n=1 Tax=Lactuca sativa TaxID=4236 RepID=A0A9R1W5R1_LACSA|nr:hypothetical protein LSAT_V11C300132560 [Lactuca sativa]